jgi:serine/threonine-protein kinase
VVFTGIANGASHLYMRGPGDFEPRLLPGTASASSPVFSPSGDSLVFVADNRLMVTPMGGAARPLATVNGPRGIAWVDEATVVYTAGSGNGLTELAINGGSPRELTTVDAAAGERTHRWPSVVPGGRWVLFTVGTNNSPDNYEAARIDAVDRQTGQRRTVFTGATSARVASSGQLLLVRESSLLAVGFDHASLTVSGEPVSVLQDIGGDPTSGAAHLALSAGGTLAYLPADDGAASRRLVWSDLDGVVQAIDLPPAVYNDVRLSPDGARLVYTLGSSGAGEVWVYSFDRGTTTRLTFTGVNATPVWSADGRDILFAAADGARTVVLATHADGGREPVAVATIEGRAELRQVSADGTWALIDLIGGGQGGRPHIARLPLRVVGTAEAIAGTLDAYGGALSPDGRLLAYQFVEGSRSEIYVRELTASGGRWQVSTAGGEEPTWSRDGATLFYRTDGKMMQVSVDRTTRFATRPPRLMFDGSFNLRSDSGISYHPHPDGKRLVMIRRAESQSSGGVRVITNWLRELSGIK